ncbi:MAG: hypothetical protein IPG00_07615 [Saprospiraceae bacterium]|nr:hypothetical protein [Saprospiraceae bacterium]HQV66438.1 hypothetical protein [Saprospiraceae bacterium]
MPSLNSRLNGLVNTKFTKNKKVFPTDDAALKSIYLAAQQIRKKWEKARFGWSQIYNQLTIYFENRIIIN